MTSMYYQAFNHHKIDLFNDEEANELASLNYKGESKSEIVARASGFLIFLVPITGECSFDEFAIVYMTKQWQKVITAASTSIHFNSILKLLLAVIYSTPLTYIFERDRI